MIVIKNLKKTHINSKTNKKVALENVNLTLPDKGLVLITGDSGSGKTTLLSILAGLDTFDSGSLVINGVEFSGYKQKDLDKWRSQESAFVFQEFNLISDYTVAENIKVSKNFQGQECTDEEVKSVLKKVKLTGFEDRMLKDLSGGEKQRVAIARALIRNPKVLFIDEPTAHIDQPSAKKILTFLKKISETILVVCVSHDIDTIKPFVNRMVTLKKGKVSSNRAVLGKKKKVAKKKPVKKKKEVPVVEPEPIDYKESRKNRHLYTIGANHVLKRKSRTIALVLLASFSLLFFAVFYMMSFYSQSLTLARSASLESPAYVALSGEISSELYDDLRDNQEGIRLAKYSSINWSSHIKGLVEVATPVNNTVGEVNVYGQRILCGKYPSYSDSTAAEIVITDYIASLILEEKIELRNDTGAIVIKATDIEDIIGNAILSENGVYLSISGIVKTDYLVYKNVEIGSKEYDNYLYNLDAIYSVIHVTPGFTQNYVTIAGLVNVNNVFVNAEKMQPYVASVGTLSSKGSKIVTHPTLGAVYDGGIGEGEIIVSNDFFDDYKNNVNAYKPTLSVNLSINGGSYKTYTIIGVLQNSPSDATTILVSDEAFSVGEDNVAKQSLFKVSKVVFNVSGISVNGLASFIDKGLSNDLVFESSNTKYINELSNNIDLFKTAIIVFGVFSLIFACVLVYNYLTLYIIRTKKDIGVLRSLGASAGDIATILLTAVGIMFISCFAVSSILTTLAAIVINAFVSATALIPFMVIHLTWHLYLVLFGVCLLVSLAATIVPIIKYSRQTPVEQLKY